jgi:hypothetical protein
MDIKNYQQVPKKPLTFEEWKGSIGPQWSDEQQKSLTRLHSIDSKKEFDDMLKREYNEYLDNLNGNWLLR